MTEGVPPTVEGSAESSGQRLDAGEQPVVTADEAEAAAGEALAEARKQRDPEYRRLLIDIGHAYREHAYRLSTPPCPTCKNQFEGRMPGHFYGSNWDWVQCQTCHGSGVMPPASEPPPKADL